MFYSAHASELSQMLARAFTAMDAQRAADNPFAPLSAAREQVHGPLRGRQIHRIDLAAIRVGGQLPSARDDPPGKTEITQI